MSGYLVSDTRKVKTLRLKEMKEKGEKIAMKEMRSHVAWYFTGRRGSAGLRRAANAITTYDGLSELVGEWLSHAESQENRG